MPAIDLSDLEHLDASLAAMLNEFPEMRRELHEELAELAKQEVDAAIGASGIHNPDKIRRWQVKHVGSGGGYAAVRAASEEEGGGTGPDSAGAITNYLEGGHKTRLPSGGKGYRPRVHVAYVKGYHFYQTARTSFEAKAIQKAEKFIDILVGRLEGGG